MEQLWERLLKHVKISKPLKCWEWLGYRNNVNGYGQITLSKKDQILLGVSQRTMTAPRLMCSLTHGPAPEGMVVLHLCDNPACCAPHHLRWGTMRENNHMAWDTNGRQKRGEEHHQAKYSDKTVEILRKRVTKGESAYAVARDLGMDISHAYKIIRGEVRA